MKLNPEARYMQLGRLVETTPNLLADQLSVSDHQWLGKLDALIESYDLAGVAELQVQVSFLGSVNWSLRTRAAQLIASILHRALAAAELQAPVAAKGSFIPAGNAFDAMGAIAKVLQTAKHDVLIVDPYMDEKALMDFAPLAAEGVAIRLLADEKDHKPTLSPAQQRFQSLNAFAARSPAAVVRVEGETSALKIDAYAGIWATAKPL